MTPADRVGVAVRAFCVAAVVGLGLAFAETRTLQGAVYLTGLAGTAMAAGRLTAADSRWVVLTEGTLAALTVGVTLPDGALLLPYLTVPALLAGSTGTRRDVVVTTGGETIALIVVLLAGGARTPTSPGLELAAPWVVAGLGAGLLAVWFRSLRGVPAAGDEASYESARRLLGQLRTVSRRLSSGLDSVTIASQILTSVTQELTGTRSAVFTRTEGAVPSPLTYSGPSAQEALHPDDPLVESCWNCGDPVQERRATQPPELQHRLALPLRSGGKVVGAVLVEGPEQPRRGVLSDLMGHLDEQALRLETALVFDEIRSLATMEERQRVAREIHDGVAQEIASLGYLVDDLSAGASGDQRARLQVLRAEISRVVTELRLSIFDLRSEVSPRAGLGSALSEYVRSVGARSGLTVHLTLDEGPNRLRPEAEAELLRIAQEAVTNARKHSAARNLWVDCRVHPPFARITVEDDGSGLGRPRAGSYGLTIMRERADRIGAALEIGGRELDKSVTGTRVCVTVGAQVASAA